jgi:hypothetical protein
MTKKKICHCGKKSIPGLVRGVALCQYHYNVRMYGKKWADYCLSIKK